MAESKMFAEERRKEILKILKRQGSATVNMISSLLKVSPSTVRNDLNLLEKKDLIYRTHGGAIAKQRFNPIFQKSISDFSELKVRIVRYAINFVNSGDAIFIDAGSTTLMFAEELIREKKSCHIITNSLYVVNALVDMPEIHVHVLGGEFKKRTMNFIDPEPCLGKYRVSKAFMGVSGFDSKGCYVSNSFEAKFKRSVMEIAQSVFVLADSTKYGKISTVLIKRWDKKDTIITDKKVEVNANLIVAS
ncbi:MAG: DeoR family transcriptional regulator [Thermotoga sp.]|nr:MAG: DeoR family transcriptional regulator [Thermotoga sp.]